MHSSARRSRIYRLLSSNWFYALVLVAPLLLVTSLRAQSDDDGGSKLEAVSADHVQRMKEGTKLFKEQVRAVLVEHCLKCHGGEAIKGEFDLSSREALMDSGMVGEDAVSSHLFAVITHSEEPHMPKDAERLPDEALAHIERWLNLGAPYDQPLVDEANADDKKPSAITEAERQFWSFQPLHAVAPPEVQDGSWVRTPIDRFILQPLERLSIRPNPVADRRTLIRRAYFDLLGLPPTPEQVDAFVNDPDPNAYDKLIDELLESPHYGERWARHWMDVARFAESHGYEQDYDRPHAYHYRDFLIKALNEDLPYDEFIRLQIAGDELEPDNPLALTATGFLGAGAFPTQLTEMEFESARYDELDDMGSTLGTAFLGLSVGCARCHDHKFDPIPASDYYRLIASFTKTIRSEIDLDLDPAGNRERQRAFDAKRKQLEEQLAEFERSQLPAALQRWLANYDPNSTAALEPWHRLQIESLSSSSGTNFKELVDGSYLAEGTTADQDVITIVATTSQPLHALRLEALRDDSLPQGGPGRAVNGNFVLSDLRVTWQSTEGSAPVEAVKFVAAEATHQQDAGPLAVAGSIDEDSRSGWAVDGGGIGKDQAAVFRIAQPIGGAEPIRLTITLAYQHPNPKHSLGRFRLTASPRGDAPVTVGGSSLDPAVQAALAKLKTTFDTSTEEYRIASQWFAPTLAEWQQHKQQLDEHIKAGPQLQLVKAQITTEGFPHMAHHADDRGFPHFYPETHILNRGDVHQKKEVATPSYLQVLMRGGYDAEHWRVTPPEGWTRTSFARASLANWITDPQHGAGHLAARVIVNRLWHHHFGRGIVTTPSDFGAQGERPSHPELLDWLAMDLIHHGWRLKRLHKLIMTSAVYMQSSEYDEHRAQVDRENMYLWRRVPRRLEAEAIRDSLLHVAGMLDRTMYGPGSLDQNMQRRSVYFFIKRSQLIPTMMLFDWPEHLVSIGQRASTTIAPQALAFMNSPQCRQYAEGYARRIASMPQDQAVQTAYKIAFGRSPSDREQQLALEFLVQQQSAYQVTGMPQPEFQALIDLCQTLMSMNEFVYID